MKKIVVSIMALSILFSCGDLEELNVNNKKAKEAPAGTLFANGQRNLSDILVSTNVNRGVWRLLAQHWTETTYFSEARYDLDTRNIPQNVWDILYRDVMMDFETARISLKELDPVFIEEELRQNQLALIDIMEVYTWSVLVNTYGPIPYVSDSFEGGEALDIDNASPAYTKAEDIYHDLITRLNADIKTLETTTETETLGSYDLLYSGNKATWLRFANSLKLRLGMTLAEAPGFDAKTIVSEAAPKVFTSSADNALIKYKETTPNTNPVWVDLVQSGREDFVAANTIVDKMVALDDPRLPAYFATVDVDGTDIYLGGIYGVKNTASNYSFPSATIMDPTLPGVLLDYSEVLFYLAEAVERGFITTGSAETYYNQAITESMHFWGVEDADIATYLARPEVAYTSAAGDYKTKIGVQKWFALYNRGHEAWTEWRRLDAPTLVAPPDAFSDVPLRFPYPVAEQNLNTVNYDDAVRMIGKDVVATPIFWDVQ